MITQGFDFIALMFGLCGVLVGLENHFKIAFFRWFPSIVLVMFGSMALYTLGLWEFTEDVRLAREMVRDNLIPAMLFLMSLKFNLAVIRKLGVRLIALCLASTLTIMLGFIVTHWIMRDFLGDETPLTFATMSAGWTGGTQNFVAVKEALSVSDEAMTYTLLMGALCYSIWLVVIIALKPFKSAFDKFLRAEDDGIIEILDSLHNLDSNKAIDMPSLILVIGLSLMVATFSNHLAIFIASAGIFNEMIWVIIISSVMGMLAAPTALGKIPASDEVSGIMLYVIVALIGAEVSLGVISEAPMYILSGVIILLIHGSILLLVARLLRINILLVGLASIANIGSAPSAAVVGAAYGRELVPVAIIMALIGSMIGSFVGLTVAEILLWLNATT
ncbi:MAG TPA: DUF819 family protein [Rhodospirillales bacterium]|nr:DUF819 family protein [Rhodospirillales bacterium]HIN89371.1 DUF819 family protein [Porticoccaceae bacterium]HIP10213.1 DUF819 family protein [Rhodospirillales bacterium]